MKSRKPVWAALALILFAGAGPQEPRTATSEEGVVRIDNCTINLIDDVMLASDRSGILAFVEPREGDRVKSGEIIAKLRDEVAEAAFAVAAKKAENDVEIRYAKKAAAVAKTEHEKAVLANKKLKDTFPEIEVERLKLAADRSDLQIEQARHQLGVDQLTRDQAAAELETYRVEAPFDGMVTRVYKSKGEAVRQGDPILDVVSTDRVRVEGYVPIQDVWSVKPGARVEVRLNIPGVALERERFEGRIVFVDVAVQVTKGVRVWAEVANTENILRAGLNADMTIFPEERAAAERVSGR